MLDLTTARIWRSLTNFAARKTNLVGEFRLGLATTEGLASALLNAIQSGRDVTWLDEYPKQIESLTLAQVNGAIKKYVSPEKMVLVKAGTVGAALAPPSAGVHQ